MLENEGPAGRNNQKINMLEFVNGSTTIKDGRVIATLSSMYESDNATLSASPGTSVFLGQVDPQGFHLPEEGAFVDSQFPGGR